MSQLGKRLISSAVLISITMYAIWGPLWFFFLMAEVLIFFGMREYYRLASKTGIWVDTVTGLGAGLLIPFALYYSVDLVFIVLAVLLMFLSCFRTQRRDQALQGIALTFFGLIYVGWFFSHTILIRHLERGSFWVFYVVLLVKGGDAAAYFFGKKFGRTKLIEHISPNKSVEGAVAGFLATFGLSLVSRLYLPGTPWIHLALMGILVGVIAPLSDLAESLLKRNVQVKDSGDVPGLGGILDVLDSLLLTIPVVYFYLAHVMGVS